MPARNVASARVVEYANITVDASIVVSVRAVACANMTADAFGVVNARAVVYANITIYAIGVVSARAMGYANMTADVIYAVSVIQLATFVASLRAVFMTLSGPTKTGARLSISVAQSLPSVGTSNNSSSLG